MFSAFSVFLSKVRAVVLCGVPVTAHPRLLTYSCGRNGNLPLWAKFVGASTPEAILATVIDDWRMFVSGPRSVEQLERVVRRTLEYDADTGTVTKMKKDIVCNETPP